MNIIATDDEENALAALVRSINRAMPDASISGFRKPQEALQYVEEQSCDVAFLDIEMRGMSGIELAKRIKILNPKVNIVFVTGYSQYMQEAFSLYVSGYVLKPVTPEKVLKEISNLRNPISIVHRKRVRIHTFGNFEVFVDGEPLKFRYGKTKELLAYLVDRRGALCSNAEAMSVLWEDEEEKAKSRSYFSNLSSDLMRNFKGMDCEDIIVKQRGKLGIRSEKVECDYFDWLDSKAYAINAYQGEYMAQYSWAEMTLGEIESTRI